MNSDNFRLLKVIRYGVTLIDNDREGILVELGSTENSIIYQYVSYNYKSHYRIPLPYLSISVPRY